MNRILMKRLVEDGEARKNASTMLMVAGIEMSKQAELLKAQSKALAAAASQMHSALMAAHEMTSSELKDYKKLLDRIEDVTAGLKKYTGYATDNVKEVLKFSDEFKKPSPKWDEPEPDPHKPFKPFSKVHIDKPKFSAMDWNLTEPAATDAAADFNKAAWKLIDALDDDLPLVVDKPKKVMSMIDSAFLKYMHPVMSKHKKVGGESPQCIAMVAKRITGWVRLILGDSKFVWES